MPRQRRYRSAGQSVNSLIPKRLRAPEWFGFTLQAVQVAFAQMLYCA